MNFKNKLKQIKLLLNIIFIIVIIMIIIIILFIIFTNIISTIFHCNFLLLIEFFYYS